jgi:putative thiamine transport system ATP-binding protein
MSLNIHLQSLRTPSRVLLENLTLEVPAGTVHTVMGPSGSGKSSLLATVCGTLDAGLQFEGRITLNGLRIDALPTPARRVGLLLQDDLLFAHMTVQENLLFAVPKGSKAQRHGHVMQALIDIEMQDFGDADPATLSGGQRARVALARALLAQPQALLLDEPFSKLDMRLRQRMRALVFSAITKRGIAALLVTHDSADIANPRQCTHV